MFELESRRAAKDIRVASDRLRELGRNAAPGVWHVAPGEPPRVTGRDGLEVAVLSGLWAPGTAAYLTAVAPNTAYLIAELMWLSESPVRKGELPTRLRNALLALAQAIPGESP
ncbi:MAG: hypothetical protein ABW215_23520 [Kibdelosporangium sp.]